MLTAHYNIIPTLNVDNIVHDAAVYDHCLTDNSSTNPLAMSVPVTVNITDVNDFRPVIVPIANPPPIREDVSTGILIASVEVTDGDSGSNAEV